MLSNPYFSGTAAASPPSSTWSQGNSHYLHNDRSTRPTGDQTQGQKFGIRTKGLQLSLATVMHTEASPAVRSQVPTCKLALKEVERGIFLWPVAFYFKSVASPSWGSYNKNKHETKASSWPETSGGDWGWGGQRLGGLLDLRALTLLPKLNWVSVTGNQRALIARLVFLGH